jgi:hypothetical protein
VLSDRPAVDHPRMVSAAGGAQVRQPVLATVVVRRRMLEEIDEDKTLRW